MLKAISFLRGLLPSLKKKAKNPSFVGNYIEKYNTEFSNLPLQFSNQYPYYQFAPLRHAFSIAVNEKLPQSELFDGLSSECMTDLMLKLNEWYKTFQHEIVHCALAQKAFDFDKHTLNYIYVKTLTSLSFVKKIPGFSEYKLWALKGTTRAELNRMLLTGQELSDASLQDLKVNNFGKDIDKIDQCLNTVFIFNEAEKISIKNLISLVNSTNKQKLDCFTFKQNDSTFEGYKFDFICRSKKKPMFTSHYNPIYALMQNEGLSKVKVLSIYYGFIPGFYKICKIAKPNFGMVKNCVIFVVMDKYNKYRVLFFDASYLHHVFDQISPDSFEVYVSPYLASRGYKARLVLRCKKEISAVIRSYSPFWLFNH